MVCVLTLLLLIFFNRASKIIVSYLLFLSLRVAFFYHACLSDLEGNDVDADSLAGVAPGSHHLGEFGRFCLCITNPS